MKKLVIAGLIIAGLAAMPAQAQFGGLGGLLGGGGGGNVDAVVASGLKISICATAASDLAVNAAYQMLDAFPDDKVAEIRGKFEKYNELKAKRGDGGQLDADQANLASDGMNELDKLDTGTYRKDKAKVVGPVYAKTGLALGIDALAATQVPTFLKSAAGTLSSMKSNPMQLTKIGKLTAVIGTCRVLATAVPDQVKALKIIRGMAQKIADAEHIALKDAPAVTTLDPAAIDAAEKSDTLEG